MDSILSPTYIMLLIIGCSSFNFVATQLCGTSTLRCLDCVVLQAMSDDFHALFFSRSENSCPPPAPLPNAVTTGNSTVEKNVSCLPGYTLAPGSPPVIYCQTNQKWTFSACEGKSHRLNQSTVLHNWLKKRAPAMKSVLWVLL